MGGDLPVSSKLNIERLRAITVQELASLGVSDVAYIRPVRMDARSKGYAIHAADGTTIGFSASQEMAMLAAHKNNLLPLTVH